jgi:hypothetical protein
MIAHRKGFAASAFAVYICLSAAVGASASTIDDDRTLVARDICTGLAANFVHGSNADISFSAGRFTVSKASGNLTVFDGAVPVTEIKGFSYSDYLSCLQEMINDISSQQKSSQQQASIQILDGAFELNKTLAIGACLQSAAQGGYYMGNLENGAILQDTFYSAMFSSVSNSVDKRLKDSGSPELRIDLNGNVQYYRFYQDREVPYFDQAYIGGKHPVSAAAG